MVSVVLNRGLILTINTIIDGGFLTILLSVWTIDDYSSAIKLITTCIIASLSIARWIVFFRDRRNDRKQIRKTK